MDWNHSIFLVQNSNWDSSLLTELQVATGQLYSNLHNCLDGINPSHTLPRPRERTYCYRIIIQLPELQWDSHRTRLFLVSANKLSNLSARSGIGPQKQKQELLALDQQNPNATVTKPLKRTTNHTSFTTTRMLTTHRRLHMHLVISLYLW